MRNVTKFGICVGSLALASVGYGSISFNIAAGVLRDENGSAINEGLVVLVASTDGPGSTFALPTASQFVQGDDVVVAKWNFSEGGGLDGEFLAPLVIGDYSVGGWSEGDPLALFWYPTLNKDSIAPGTAKFGVFTDPIDESTGDRWAMPADNTHLYSLQFFAEGSVLSQASFADQYVAAATLDENSDVDLTDVMPAPVKTSPTSNTVAWDLTAGAQSYTIQRRKVGDTAWSTLGAVSSVVSSFEDSNLSPGSTYQYRVIASNGLSALPSASDVELFSERSTFVNISSRANVDQDSSKAAFKLLNVGVQVSGNDPDKRLMALGFGPHRNATIGTTAWVDDTLLEYEIGTTAIGSNDNWMDDGENPGTLNPDASAILTTMQNVGSPIFFEDDPDTGFVAKDSAMLEDVPINMPTRFRATSLDDSGFIAVGLYDAEYDPASANDNRIVNLSSRGYLSDGGRFNGALVIGGNVPKEVLAVVAGPFLRDARGVHADVVLQNPSLNVQRLSGPNGNQVVLDNLDWDTQDGVADPANGLLAVETDVARLTSVLESKNFSTDSMTLDAAVLVTLEPGQYAFRVNAEDDGVSRADGSVLIALWEIE